MSAKTRSFCKLSLSVVIFCVLSTTTVVVMHGQTASTQTTSKPAVGVPDDWTHHHLVFSNPGSITDAVRTGRVEQWNKINNDRRFQMQQWKRDPTRRALAGAQDYAARTAIVSAATAATAAATTTSAATSNARQPAKANVKKDWNMDTGGGPTAASLTVAVSAATTGDLPSGAYFTINTTPSHRFTASAPTSESATLTFTGLPTTTTNATVTVTNGTNNFVLTENGAVATATGAFATPQTTTATLLTITSGPSTIHVTTTATAASFPLTLDSGGETTTGSIIYTYTGGASSVRFTITPVASGGGSCSGSAGAYTGTFTESTSATTAAGNFRTALSACVTAASLGSSLTVSGTTTAVLTDVYLGNFLSVTKTLGNTSGTITTGGNGSAACTLAGSTYTVDYVSSNSTSTMASNLLSELNACAAGADIHASNLSGSSLTISSTVLGTGSFATSAIGVFNYTSTNNGSVGSPACGSSGSSGNTFGTGTTTGAVATALRAVLITCSATIQAQTGINASATVTGSGVNIFAYIPGTTGGSGISIAAGSGLSTSGGGSLSGGSDGTTSGTLFKYWTGNAYDTQSQLTTDIANALGDNTTISTDFTINPDPATGDILITDKTTGTSGNGITLTRSTGFTAITAGTFGGGTTGSGSVGAGNFPAKYSFSTTNAGNCGNATPPDYVVYNTGTAGVSGSQANIIAYDNIYTGCTAPVPAVYWSYFTGTGSVVTSPVLSLDGTKVAFIETPTSGAATLRILKWAAGEGTDYNNAVAPDQSLTSGTPWSACTSASCMISVTFQSPGANPDTTSSPWYDYDTDTLWVGDSGGYLHKFTGVFNGTPAEVVVTNVWPANVYAGHALTSPVMDIGQGYLFMGDSSGEIDAVDASTGVFPNNYQQVGLTVNDGPLVDPTAGTQYIAVSCYKASPGCATGANPPDTSEVYQFNYSSHVLTEGTEVSVGTFSNSIPIYAGAFDDAYYNSEVTSPTSPTGNLWICGNPGGTPILYAIPINGGTSGDPMEPSNPEATLSNATTPCSPVTEFLNGTTDYIFVSPQTQSASGAQGCPGSTGCVISYSITSGTYPTILPTATLLGSGGFAGGASGIIVDTQNISPLGTSMLYFGVLGSGSCTGAGGAGTGTGGCAIQASQANPLP